MRWPSPRSTAFRCCSTRRQGFHQSRILPSTPRWDAISTLSAAARGFAGPNARDCCWGRKDLIEAALANSSPFEGAVCRAMKVGKEEIMGCLAAVEAWKKRDLAALDREWNAKVKRIARLVETVPGVTTDVQIPKDGIDIRRSR